MAVNVLKWMGDAWFSIFVQEIVTLAVDSSIVDDKEQGTCVC